MLQLFLRLPWSAAAVPVDVSADATVSDLRRAVAEAGGPEPRLQRLAIGGEELLGEGDTLLSDTPASMEAVVTVAAVRQPSVSAAFSHVLAILEDGSVVGRGHSDCWYPVPDFGTPDSVCAGCEYSAAVVGGRLEVWGAAAGCFAETLAAANEVAAVRCASSACADLIAVVGVDRRVRLCGPDSAGLAVPDHLQGRAVSVSCGSSSVAILTDSGCAVIVGEGGAEVVAEAGALAVAAGMDHHAVLMAGGEAVCGGCDSHGQCAPPACFCARTVSCGCFYTAALTAAGELVCWGDVPDLRQLNGVECTQVSAGVGFVAAVTAGGELVTCGRVGL